MEPEGPALAPTFPAREEGAQPPTGLGLLHTSVTRGTCELEQFQSSGTGQANQTWGRCGGQVMLIDNTVANP